MTLLRFEHHDPARAYPVEIDMNWDGDDFVVWITMDSCADELAPETTFGIGGFNLHGVNVKAVANFQLTEDQAREWRDALTALLEAPA